MTRYHLGILIIGGIGPFACSSPGQEPAPIESVMPVPVAPVCPVPTEPVCPAPVQPVCPAPVQPVTFGNSATRGDVAFHERALPGFSGNGRACSDCHMDSNGFQLSPANVEARFQQMSSSGIDDPLFRPIDADDFVANGQSASDYSNLRGNGLIRVRMPLPPNIKVVEPGSCMTAGAPAPCDTATTYAVSDAMFTDVWRSVPSVLNVSVTGNDSQPSIWPRGPNPQGGYQLDGRVDTLQNQARGAFLGHAQLVVAPGAAILDDIAAYEGGLFANPEPPLNDLETQGKAVFDRACGTCHTGPGMSSPTTRAQKILRFLDIFAECPRPVDTVSPARWNFAPCPPALARNAQTYEISFADGFKMRRTTSDPGRALLSGFVFSDVPAADGSCVHPPCGAAHLDDWQKLEITPLHGISKTAPYFHNNSAATLEEVVKHYEEFFKRSLAVNASVVPIPPVLTTDGVHRDRPNVPEERAALVAYLGKL
jgi:cytochrome c peroxidase